MQVQWHQKSILHLVPDNPPLAGLAFSEVWGRGPKLHWRPAFELSNPAYKQALSWTLAFLMIESNPETIENKEFEKLPWLIFNIVVLGRG